MPCKYKTKDGKSIWIFCKEKELSYRSVSTSIRYYIKKWPEKDLEDIIKFVLTKHLKLHKNKTIINFINNIDRENNWNFSSISKTLNIEYSSMNKLSKYNFSKKEAFYIVWFLFDKISKNDKITITQKRINEFLTLYNTSNINENTDLKFLITLIKIGNKNALNEFLKIRTKQISTIIRRNIYNKSYYLNNKDDIESEVLYKELSLYQKLCLNTIPQIIKYLNKFAKYTTIKYIKNDKDRNCLHLDDNIFDNKNRYDFISK